MNINTAALPFTVSVSSEITHSLHTVEIIYICYAQLKRSFGGTSSVRPLHNRPNPLGKLGNKKTLNVVDDWS